MVECLLCVFDSLTLRCMRKTVSRLGHSFKVGSSTQKMATKRKYGESEKEKVVLAYSGGLDTSVILVWLVEKGKSALTFHLPSHLL